MYSNSGFRFFSCMVEDREDQLRKIPRENSSLGSHSRSNTQEMVQGFISNFEG